MMDGVASLLGLSQWNYLVGSTAAAVAVGRRRHHHHHQNQVSMPLPMMTP
jgi:hypothetical protein